MVILTVFSVRSLQYVSEYNKYMVLITGGAGFIGGNFVLDWLSNPNAEPIINLDKLTYAGN